MLLILFVNYIYFIKWGVYNLQVFLISFLFLYLFCIFLLLIGIVRIIAMWISFPHFIFVFISYILS